VSQTTTEKPEYLSIREAAGRIGCSVRHLERIIAVNDRRRIGLAKIGRRLTRLNWAVFEQAFLAGQIRS
jgi:hypothetical protein